MTLIADDPTRPAVADRDNGSPLGWWRWTSAAAVVGATVLLLAIRPNLVVTTLRSPRALALVGAVSLGVALVSRFAIARFVAPPLVRVALRLALVVAAAAPLLVPSFRTTRVDEALPVAAGPAPAVAAMPEEPLPPPPAALPAPAAAIPEEAPPPPVPPQVPVPAPPPPQVPAQPAGPVELTRGELSGIGHRASGGAALYRLADGRAIVRLENIDIEPGPDYNVYLVAGSGQRSPGGGRNLGDLKANQGSHNYEISGGLEDATTYTVLVWCQRFAVPVAHATQLPL